MISDFVLQVQSLLSVEVILWAWTTLALKYFYFSKLVSWKTKWIKDWV